MPAPIRIIVGLGNPGHDYAETRHNVGFMVVDRVAAELGAVWKADKARKAEIAAAAGVLLVKPQTFMNLSGESVGPLMRYYKYEPEQVLLIHDDTAFPIGTMKLRTSGSAGGHNGVKSIIAHLGSEHFPRIRVGIGLPRQKEMVGHVLGRFSPEERPLLDSCLAQAAQAARCALQEGFELAANRFNPKKEKHKPDPAVETATEKILNPPHTP